MTCKLSVVCTPIGNLSDLSPGAAAVLKDATLVLCEDTRHSPHQHLVAAPSAADAHETSRDDASDPALLVYPVALVNASVEEP